MQRNSTHILVVICAVLALVIQATTGAVFADGEARFEACPAGQIGVVVRTDDQVTSACADGTIDTVGATDPQTVGPRAAGAPPSSDESYSASSASFSATSASSTSTTCVDDQCTTTHSQSVCIDDSCSTEP
jgi:hypothetical protein